jgi:hypothetical protein
MMQGREEILLRGSGYYQIFAIFCLSFSLVRNDLLLFSFVKILDLTLIMLSNNNQSL